MAFGSSRHIMPLVLNSSNYFPKLVQKPFTSALSRTLSCSPQTVRKVEPYRRAKLHQHQYKLVHPRLISIISINGRRVITQQIITLASEHVTSFRTKPVSSTTTQAFHQQITEVLQSQVQIYIQKLLGGLGLLKSTFI